jgi:hypothetical protein
MIAIARSSFDAQGNSGSFSEFASGCARSANAAMKSLFDTLDVVHGEKEKRGFVKLNVISLSFSRKRFRAAGDRRGGGIASSCQLDRTFEFH